jgi:HK97 gp10 family phage protein
MKSRLKIVKNNVAKVKSSVNGEGLVKIIKAGGNTLLAFARINVNKSFSKEATGALQESIQLKVTAQNANSAKCQVGPTMIYGRIQELGGTIKAINSSFLTIPVTGAAKAAGSSRGMDLKPIMNKSRSSGVLVDKAGTVHFVLKSQVTLPARPYLRPAFDEHKSDIKKAMAQTFKELIKKGT